MLTLARLALDESALGAVYLGGGRTAFTLWAPRAATVDLLITAPVQKKVRMQQAERGYHRIVLDEILPGTRYFFQLPQGSPLPDPCSRSQPDGVHEASEVIDHAFEWTDANWRGPALDEYVIYELHVGTFSHAGTFDGVADQLDALVELGITAIELMPLAQFPGSRNWGYDGVFPFAVQISYGGHLGLKRLVDAAHARGLAVVLDVVYNHLGPEGNYSNQYGHYFTDRYHTPWGAALNFDGPGSDEVRRFFIDNALEWVTQYHIDALRLDAIHAIVDESARPFLLELGEAIRNRAAELNRHIYTIAETNRNDPRFITPVERGGIGLDAQWNDDVEHALRVALTGQTDGYYCDFVGFDKLAKALREGYVNDGGYSPFYGRRHGAPSHSIAAEQLVVFSQNHDQIGNRPCGERLTQLVDFESIKLAAATVILSPYLPLLFMGEEYGEPAPFLYFVSHTDKGLQDAVRNGRRAEFVGFQWPEEWPDPCRTKTFHQSRLHFELRKTGKHAVLWNFYRELIQLRKRTPALRRLSKEQMEVTTIDEQVLAVRRWEVDSEVVLLLNFAKQARDVSLPLPAGSWKKVLDSAEARWANPDSDAPRSTLPTEIASPLPSSLNLAPRSVSLWSQIT